MRHPKSILQPDAKQDFLWAVMEGIPVSGELEKHHIFGGAYRKKSEKYGLVVYLCHRRCHIFAPSAVHQSTGQMQRLKRYGQLKAMEEQRWTEEDFRREFGKSYL